MAIREKTIGVWTEAPQEAIKAATPLPAIGSSGAMKVVQVGISTISANISGFIRDFESNLSKELPTDSRFVVDEIELTLAITASGGVELVGKLSAGAQAGIKVKLKCK